MAKSDLGRPSPFSMKASRSSNPATYPTVLRIESDTTNIQERLGIIENGISIIIANQDTIMSNQDIIMSNQDDADTKLDTIINNTAP